MLLLASKNGMTVPSKVMGGASRTVVGGASRSPPRVPNPPSTFGGILDLTDSELSQGLISDAPIPTTKTFSTGAVLSPQLSAAKGFSSARKRGNLSRDTEAVEGGIFASVGGSSSSSFATTTGTCTHVHVCKIPYFLEIPPWQSLISSNCTMQLEFEGGV